MELNEYLQNLENTKLTTFSPFGGTREASLLDTYQDFFDERIGSESLAGGLNRWESWLLRQADIPIDQSTDVILKDILNKYTGADIDMVDLAEVISADIHKTQGLDLVKDVMSEGKYGPLLDIVDGGAPKLLPKDLTHNFRQFINYPSINELDFSQKEYDKIKNRVQISMNDYLIGLKSLGIFTDPQITSMMEYFKSGGNLDIGFLSEDFEVGEVGRSNLADLINYYDVDRLLEEEE